MTANFIKLTLLPALLSHFLVGILAVVASAHTDSNQQETPAGKRKSLHEYGPEDILPEARENENPKPRKDQAQQPEASNRTPLTSRPTVTPTPTPTPTVTPTPTSAESAVPATTMTPSEPQKVKNSGALRRKLLVSSSIFLLLLLILGFFVARMRRQLREDREAVTAPTAQEQRPAAKRRQLRADGQAKI